MRAALFCLLSFAPVAAAETTTTTTTVWHEIDVGGGERVRVLRRENTAGIGVIVENDSSRVAVVRCALQLWFGKKSRRLYTFDEMLTVYPRSQQRKSFQQADGFASMIRWEGDCRAEVARPPPRLSCGDGTKRTLKELRFVERGGKELALEWSDQDGVKHTRSLRGLADRVRALDARPGALKSAAPTLACSAASTPNPGPARVPPAGGDFFDQPDNPTRVDPDPHKVVPEGARDGRPPPVVLAWCDGERAVVVNSWHLWEVLCAEALGALPPEGRREQLERAFESVPRQVYDFLTPALDELAKRCREHPDDALCSSNFWTPTRNGGTSVRN